MKKLFLFIITALAFYQCKSKLPSEQNFKRTIQLTSTYQLCGGMMPSPEDQLASRTETPLPNYKLYIRSGNQNSLSENILIELTTDAFGLAEFELPVGSYCLVDSQKANEKQIEEWKKEFKVASKNWDAIEEECLEEWIKEPLLKFEVYADKEQNKEVLNLNIHRKCFWNAIPCVVYRGPFPS